MDALHFLRPYYLLALVPAVIILFLLLRKRGESSGWANVCDPHLLRHIIIDKGKVRTNASLFFLMLAWIVTVIALAGPAWEKAEQPVYRNQRAVVVVLDMSYSMLAQDIKPSRVQRAKYKVLDMLERNKDGQTSLVVFAGDAHAVTPLTDDINTIKSQIEPLNPMIMPFPGSRPDQGLERALELLKNGAAKQGEIILLTDGTDEYWEQMRDAAAEVHAKGHRLSIIGVGTRQGAPIPWTEGGFIQDKSGNIVLPKLDEKNLRLVANETAGKYIRITVDNSDIEAIENFNFQQKKIDKEKQQQFSASWSDAGYWLVFLLLPIALISFRKGMVFSIIFMVMLVPDSLYAADNSFLNSELWKRKEQVGVEQFKQGDYAEAEQNLQQNPLWKGVAQYKAGKFEQAIKTFEQVDSALADYNRGNALAQMDRYEDAVAAYEKALEKDPDNKDAQGNKELLENHLQEQESQQQQSKDKQSEEQSEGKDGENQEQQDGEKQDGEQQDGEQQDGEKNKGQQSEEEQPPLDSQEQGKEGQDKDQQEPEKESEQAKQAREAQEKKEAEEKNEAQQMQQESEQPPQQKPLDQKTEQWLRQIPDNPGGLMKRKFYFESKKKYDKGTLPSSKNKW